jgi:F1F0 ATPase subunit 2
VSAVGAAAAVTLGLALAGAYFGGLWWTVARLPRWRRPGWALAASFVVRGALLLTVLALLARQGVVPLLLALVGFLGARVALSAWLRPPAAPATAMLAAPPGSRPRGRRDGDATDPEPATDREPTGGAP